MVQFDAENNLSAIFLFPERDVTTLKHWHLLHCRQIGNSLNLKSIWLSTPSYDALAANLVTLTFIPFDLQVLSISSDQI